MTDDSEMPESIIRYGKKNPSVGGAVYLFQSGKLSKEETYLKIIRSLANDNTYLSIMLRLVDDAIKSGNLQAVREARHASVTYHDFGADLP